MSGELAKLEPIPRSPEFLYAGPLGCPKIIGVRNVFHLEMQGTNP